MDKKSREEINRKLDKSPSCYVLITCDPMSEGGKLQVDMTYRGDPVLVSYLLEGARGIVDDEDENRLSYADAPVALV